MYRDTPVAVSKGILLMQSSSERGAVGSGSTTDTSKFHYDTPAVQVGNAIRDGDQFVLLVRGNQSDGYQVWSSGDKNSTPTIVREAMRQLNLEPATT